MRVLAVRTDRPERMYLFARRLQGRISGGNLGNEWMKLRMLLARRGSELHGASGDDPLLDHPEGAALVDGEVLRCCLETVTHRA